MSDKDECRFQNMPYGNPVTFAECKVTCGKCETVRHYAPSPGSYRGHVRHIDDNSSFNGRIVSKFVLNTSRFCQDCGFETRFLYMECCKGNHPDDMVEKVSVDTDFENWIQAPVEVTS